MIPQLRERSASQDQFRLEMCSEGGRTALLADWNCERQENIQITGLALFSTNVGTEQSQRADTVSGLQFRHLLAEQSEVSRHPVVNAQRKNPQWCPRQFERESFP